MFRELIWRLGAGLVAAMLTAAAAAIALFAAAFGLYAALRLALSAPAAAGLTAVAFAAVAGLIILVAPPLISRRAKSPRRGEPPPRGEASRGAAEVALAVLSVVADLALRRRTKPRKEKLREKRERKPKAIRTSTKTR